MNINKIYNAEELYDILEPLGEGSYGKVFKAFSKELNDIVALKLICIENDENDLKDIIKEIAILSNCTSPFIVHYYKSFIYESYLWISMEYCVAGSVADIINKSKNNQLQENIIAAICANVIKGMKYLHEKGNIHRDIKAGNILLTKSGHAKLADFGVSAQLSNTIAKRNTVIGTPFWMAPEVIQESLYDGKADVWSLGITAIEMAEGDPPHHKIHPMRAIFLIPSHPAPILQESNKYSNEFNDFISKCLIKDPKDRPKSSDLIHHPFIKDYYSILDNNEEKGLEILQDFMNKNLNIISNQKEIEIIDSNETNVDIINKIKDHSYPSNSNHSTSDSIEPNESNININNNSTKTNHNKENENENEHENENDRESRSNINNNKSTIVYNNGSLLGAIHNIKNDLIYNNINQSNITTGTMIFKDIKKNNQNTTHFKNTILKKSINKNNIESYGTMIFRKDSKINKKNELNNQISIDKYNNDIINENNTTIRNNINDTFINNNKIIELSDDNEVIYKPLQINSNNNTMDSPSFMKYFRKKDENISLINEKNDKIKNIDINVLNNEFSNDNTIEKIKNDIKLLNEKYEHDLNELKITYNNRKSILENKLSELMVQKL